MSATGVAFRALSAGLLVWAVQASAFEKGRSDAAFLAQAQDVQAQVAPLPPARQGFSPGDVFQGVVASAHDADTVRVKPSDGGAEVSVRLEHIDAPEVANPEYNKSGQPYGDEAAEFLRKLCAGKTVTVRVKEVDKYGRLIGWVELPDGTAVQKELLREGWAWWNFFFSKDQALNQLENEAIKARRGLWGGKDAGGEKWPEAPWVFRRREAAGIKRLLPGDKADYEALDMREPDGDTVKISRQDVYGYVRLAGIDAPEVSHRGKPGQPYGTESGARLIALVAAESKRIQIEVEDVDAYGRIVAWVKLPSRGETLNEILLAEGFAWWYESYYPNRDDLKKKQDAARAAELGLWADPSPVPPWDFRRRSQKVN